RRCRPALAQPEARCEDEGRCGCAAHARLSLASARLRRPGRQRRPAVVDARRRGELETGDDHGRPLHPAAPTLSGTRPGVTGESAAGDDDRHAPAVDVPQLRPDLRLQGTWRAAINARSGCYPVITLRVPGLRVVLTELRPLQSRPLFAYLAELLTAHAWATQC